MTSQEAQLDRSLEEALRTAEAFGPPTLGASKMLALGKEEKERLTTQLSEQIKFIDKIIVAIVILHFLLFSLAAFLVLYWRDYPKVIAVLLGGSVLSLMVIIRSLVNLVKTRSKIGTILIVLPNLSAEQAIVLIQSIYFEAKQKR